MDTDLAKVLIAAVVALWGALIACVAYIRTDKDRQIADLRAQNAKLEEELDERGERYVELLERLAEISDRQTRVTETALKARRRPAGSD